MNLNSVTKNFIIFLAKLGENKRILNTIQKRIVDVAGAIICLCLVSPLMILTAIWIRLVMGHPIIFRQQRPGLYGKPFCMFKFRTMKNVEENEVYSLSDADRLTHCGCFLRSTSLDELPELFNVLRGEMSLVGPRPLLMKYLELYTPEQARRHNVKPGITGWAQINGRNAIIWEEKFKLDVWYVDNMSLLLDFKIILITIWKIIKREGINQRGHVTTEEFMGGK